MSRDGVAGLICLALSLGMLALTRGLPKSPFVPVGPGFYPRIVLVIMVIFSVMLVGMDLWRWRASKKAAAAAPETAEAAPEKRNYTLVGTTFAIFTGYVVLLPLVGYRISTFLFVLALQPALDPPRTARRWVFIAITALLTSGVTYLIFDQYLDVLLPRGSWTDW